MRLDSALRGCNRAATELLQLCGSALRGSPSAYRITCFAATKELTCCYRSTNTDQKCVFAVLSEALPLHTLFMSEGFEGSGWDRYKSTNTDKITNADASPDAASSCGSKYKEVHEYK
jgi:hypothetical protein